MTISLAPRLAAFLRKVAATGWFSAGRAPMTMMQSAVLGRRERRRHRAGVQALHQRRHRGGVAQPRAVVDVVGAEALADQLLEEVGLLVGALGRAEAGDRLAAVARVDRLQAGRRLVERLLPGRLAEVLADLLAPDLHVGVLGDAVAADQRLGQPVGMVDVVEAEAALDAQPVVVGGPVAAVDVEDLVVLDVHRGLAADAAIGAQRVDRLGLEVDALAAPRRAGSSPSARRSGTPARTRRRRRRSTCPCPGRSRTRPWSRGRDRPCRSRRWPAPRGRRARTGRS